MQLLHSRIAFDVCILGASKRSFLLHLPRNRVVCREIDFNILHESRKLILM